MAISDALLQRIRAEFTEMPGLKLTVAQARRLWAAADAECIAALEALTAEGFLRQTPSGAFIALPRPAGYSLKSSPMQPSRCPNCRHLNSVRVEAGKSMPNGVTFRCVACGRVVSVTAQSA